jgi:xanthine dehydrogenase YagR molybdenum-binding subunit
MSLLRSVMETVARVMPERKRDPLLGKTGGYVGRPLPRVDGRMKVTGEARFTADVAVDHPVHAVLLHSTIARGRIVRIDTSAAERSPGFIAVVTHLNAPKMNAPHLLNVMNMRTGFAASNLPTMQDDVVRWDGQPVAVVVAGTLEQAEYAAALVRVEYQPETPRVSFEDLKPTAVAPDDIIGEPAHLRIGDAETALAAAAVATDHVYRTPWENHNAIELHATTASWNDDGTVTVFDSTQFINGYKHLLAEIFGVTASRVRVIAAFVGGGFGGKLGMWSNTVLCVAAAKVVKRPVRLVLSREAVFRATGGRSLTEQRVALGAASDGRLTGLIHTCVTATPTHARYAEQCTFPARHLYRAEHLFVGQTVVNLDTVANTWMRAPGESVGSFALESALDELACELKMDPIELRARNEPERDPTKGTAFSSRHLLRAYERGAEAFGWSERPAAPGSRRAGKWLVGYGVATAYYPFYRFPATVRLRLSADGSVLVQAVANEIGGGTATVQMQQVADRMGVPIEKVTFDYGDSALPDSTIEAGGSSQAASIGGALQAAVEKLHRRLLTLAREHGESPLANTNYGQAEARDGGLFRIDDRSRGETYQAILARAQRDSIEIEGSSGQPMELMQYSMASYGAQFCEVGVHAESGEVRVTRWLGSFDCGRILNPQTATSQLRGGIVMGIGMALTEETLFDERRGRILNRSLADYHVPVNLDVPDIEVIYTDIADPRTPFGARGLGEIGITGAAAAVANAVFNATGKRVRDLPITLDKLL